MPESICRKTNNSKGLNYGKLLVSYKNWLWIPIPIYMCHYSVHVFMQSIGIASIFFKVKRKC